MDKDLLFCLHFFKVFFSNEHLLFFKFDNKTYVIYNSIFLKEQCVAFSFDRTSVYDLLTGC